MKHYLLHNVMPYISANRQASGRHTRPVRASAFGQLLLLLSLLGGSHFSLGQTTIAGFDVSTVTGTTSKTLAASTVGAGVIVTPLTQGTGVAGGNAARGFGGSGWNQNTANATINADKYLTFSVQAAAGKVLSLSAINPFNYKISGTGPPSGVIQYSINGGAFTAVVSPVTFSTANTGSSLTPIDLSGISALQNLSSSSIVTFRIVPYNAVTANGTWYIYDTNNSTAPDLAVTGTLITCPTITATLNGTTTICAGNSTTLSAGISGGVPPYTIKVSDGTSNTTITGYTSGSAISITPATSKTYTIVSVADANTCTGTVNGPGAGVTVAPNPVAAITNLAGIYCKNAAPVTLTGTPAGGNFTIDGVTASVFDPSSLTVGQHTVVYSVTNASNCSATTSQTVQVKAAPTPAITGLANNYCKNEASVTLTGTPTGGDFTIDGLAATVFDPASLTLGQHTVVYSVTNNAGCTASDSKIVRIKAVPTPVITGSLTVCAGTSTTLTASGGDTYVWSTSATTASIVVPSGTYSVTATINPSGCFSTTSATVTDVASPTATLTGTTTVCTGSSASLAATITGGTGSYSLTYSDGTGTTAVSGYASGAAIAVSPAVSTTYTIVAVTDANGCAATVSGTAIVTVNPQPSVSSAGTPQTITPGSTATLSANAPTDGTGVWSVASGPSTVASQFSSTTSPTATFTPAGGLGAYVLTWTISNAPCPPSSSNVTITVAQPTCGTLTVPGNYTTIQAAIDAACSGALIQVAAGTYTEQLTIAKSLSIVGAGSNTIIKAPAGVLAVGGPVEGSYVKQNIVEIKGGAAVTLAGLTVQGTVDGSTNACYTDAFGIYVYDNASLALTDASIKDARLTDPALFGCQVGFALGVGLTGSPGSATLTNVTMAGYQKGGILARGAGTVLVADHIAVTGIGATTATGQNGVQVSEGASATITSSTIADNSYISTGTFYTGSGLITDDTGPVLIANTLISGNDVGLDAGDGGALTLTGNMFSNSSYASVYIEPAGTLYGFTGAVASSGNTFDKQVTNNNRAGTIYSAIQAAIDDAAAGDVLTAQAGTFTEDLTIGKSLTLLGANANIDPNTGTRVAETIVLPATAGNDLIYVSDGVANVTINGFTLDGDNPGLNGAGADAATGLSTQDGVVSGVQLTNNIVRNIIDIGVNLDPGAAKGSPATGGHAVKHNKIDNIGTGFGIGVLLQNNAYADVTDNVITRARSGVQTGNFYLAAPTGTTPVITGNTIAGQRVGIFHNLQYNTATPFTIAGNTLSVDASGAGFGVVPRSGLLLFSLSVPATVSSNTVAAGFANGAEVWNTGDNVTLSGGALRGSTAGIWLKNYDNAYLDASSKLTVSGVSVTNSPVGVLIADNPVAAAGNSTSAIITNNTQITGAGAFTAVAISGTDASATITGNAASFVGNGSGVGVDVNGGAASVTANRVVNFATGISVSNGGQLTGAANNFITGNTTGVAYAANASSSQGTVTSNDLSGNTGKAITNGLTSTTIGATCNWYGTTNVDGQAATLFTGAVTYSPYLNSGTDTDNNSATGFQPVSGACVSNQPPVASIIANQTATVGLAYSFTVPAYTDPENMTLAYTASINPANGLVFDPATRVISGTPAVTGVSNVTVVATDPGSMSASQTFTITVNPVPCVQSVTNVTTGATYCTIQSAVDAATTGQVISVGSGTYDELVTVPKSLTIQGVGAGSVVTYTGSPIVIPGSTTPTLFKVTATDVTIQNLTMNVDLSKIRSAIHTSGTTTNLAVLGNTITPSGTPGNNYGVRNAIAINPNLTNNSYTYDNTGFTGVVVKGNTVNVSAGGILNSFRAAVQMDLSGGIIGGSTAAEGNTFTAINHDVNVRFSNQGPVTIQHNTSLGGGIQFSEPNAGAGLITIADNTLTGTTVQPSTGPLGTGALMRIQNNGAGITLNVTGNTFTDYRWAMSVENFNTITLNGNTFTPRTSSTDYRSISFNTKLLASTSSTITPVNIGATLTNNTFNGSGATGGTAIAFFNHRQDGASPTIGTYTLGTPGNENTFNAGIGTFLRLDNSTGPSSGFSSPFGDYTVAGAPSTPMNYWTPDLNAVNNKFDVGTGLKLASNLTSTDRATLDGQLFDKNDDSHVGRIIYYTPVHNVTQNTYFPTIQSAVDAATAGDVLSAAAGTYAENVTLSKSLTILGANAGIDPNTGVRGAETIVVPAVSSADPDNGTSVVFQLSNASTSVTLDGLLIDGDNPALSGGVAINGADINALAGVSGYGFDVNGLTIKNNIIQNFTGDGVDLGGANGLASTHQFLNNKFDNIAGQAQFTGSGQAIYIGDNAYSTITNNVMTRVIAGVQTGNFYRAAAGAGSTISSNTISAYRVGIYHNLQYQSATGTTIQANTLSADAGLSGVTPNAGIRLYSITDAVAATAQSNTVNAGFEYGVYAWNTPSSGNVNVTGGAVQGSLAGIRLLNHNNFGDGSVNLKISGVAITGSPVGVLVVDDPAAAAGVSLSALVTDNTQITGTGAFTAVALSGPDASATITGNAASFVGNGSGTGVDVSGGKASVTANRIVSFATGISVSNGGQLTSAANNFITGNTTGINYTSDAGTTQGTVTINDLSGNTNKALVNGLTSTTIDANCNWFGPASATTNPTYVSGNVSTTQVLANNTDEAPGTPGFQNTSCFTPPTAAPVLTATPPAADYHSPNNTYCIGENPAVTSNYTTGVNSFTVQALTDGSTTVTTGNSVTISQGAGTYFVYATNTQNGYTSPVSATTTIQVQPVVTSFTSSKAAYCVGETVSLTALGCNVATASQPSLYFVRLRALDGSNNPNTGTANLASGVSSFTYTQFATATTTSYTITAECVNGGTGNVCSVSQLAITVNPLPASFTVTGGGAYCTGGPGVPVGLSGSETGVSYQLYNGASTVGTPVAGTGSALSFSTVTAAGTYSVVATNTATSCQTAMTGSATVSIIPTAAAPVLTASAPANPQGGSYNATYCISENPTVTTDYTTGINSFTVQALSGGSLTVTTGNSVTISQGAGTYFVYATNTQANGCTSPVSATTTLQVQPVVTSFTADKAAYCVGETVSLTALGCNVATASQPNLYFVRLRALDGSGNENQGTANLPSGVSSYTYTQFNAATTTSYTITAECVNGGTGNVCAKTSLAITVNPLPVATLVSSGTLTCNQPTATLTATGGQSYTFTGPGVVSSDPIAGTAVVNKGGSYSVSVTSASGCSSMTMVRVYKDLTAPTATLVASGTLSCNQPSVTLTAGGGTTYAFTGTGLVSQDVSGSAIVNAGGVYSVTATGANGCFDVATVRVYKDLSTPTASLVASGTLSCNQPSVTLTAGGGTTYAFTGAGLVSQDVSGSAIVNAGGVYSVTATGANGCFDVATVRVYKDLTAPTASLVASGTLSCNQPSVTLTAGGGTTYAFTGTGLVSQDVSGSAIVNAGGVYSVTATGANGCFDVATVRVYKDLTAPTASLVASGTLSCNQPSVTLTAGGGTTYAFTGTGLVSQDVSGSAIVNAGGVYSVTATGANGCFDVATVRVYKDLSTPTASLVASGTLSCNQPSVTLTAGGGTTYAFTGTGLVSQDVSGSAIVNAGGVYSVTATGANGCFDVATVRVYKDLSTPTASLVASGTLSCNQPSVTLTAGGGTTYAFTGTGLVSQDVSGSAIVNAGGVYSVTATGANGCFDVATVRVYKDLSTPTASLVASGTLSCNQPSVTLTAGGGTTYAFTGTGLVSQDVSGSAIVNAGGVYSVTATGANGCFDVATVRVYKDLSTPTASLVASGTLSCNQPSVTLTAGGGTTYAFTGTGLVSQDVSGSAIVNAGGVYSVTATGANGCFDVATVRVYKDLSTPTASLVASGTLSCNQPSVTLTAGGGTTYAFTGAGLVSQDVSGSAIVNAGGVYSVTATGANGCFDVATVRVYKDLSTPTASLVASGTLSCNQPSVTLTAGGGTTYAFTGTGLVSQDVSGSAIVNAGGVYSVTATGANGCFDVATVRVYKDLSTPTASLVASGTLSCNQPSVTLTAGGGTTYAFTGTGLVSQDVSGSAIVNAGGVYSVTATGANGCFDVATVRVYKDLSTPTASLVASGTLSCNQPSVTLTAGGGTTYAFTGAGLVSQDVSGSAIVNAGGVYSVTATGANGCFDVATVRVYKDLSTPTASLVASGTLSCNQPSVTLTAGGGTTYAFTGAGLVSQDVSGSAIVNAGGVYSVTATGANGCFDVATVRVYKDLSTPTASLVASGTLSCNQPSVTLTAGGGTTYAFTGTGLVSQDVSGSAIVNAGGVYSVTATGANGCFDVATVRVYKDLSTPTASLVASGTLSCNQPSVTLTAGGGTTYAFTGAGLVSQDVSGSAIVNAGGVYSVTATGANGCFDVATVRVYKDLSTPTASLVASGTLSCNQPSVTLTAGGGTTYAFTGTGLVSQDVSGSAIVNAGGVYSVTATGANGCFDVATVRVYKDLSTPTASLVASGTLSCNQPSVTLTAGGGTTYAFTGTGLVSQDVSGSAIVNAGGVYSVTATGANGCFDVATVRVYKDLSTPTASLVASGTLSCNQPSVTLTAGGGTTYAFTGTGLVSQDVSGSAIVNAGGVYSVTATGANGCFDVATVRVYKDLSTPTASLVASGTLSCNQPSVTLTAGGGTTYAFTGTGLVSQDVSGSAIVNAGGVYSVTATGANGCFDVATVRVYKDLSTPTASLVASGTLSCNQPSVTLTAGGGTTYAFTGAGLVSQDVSGSAIVNAGGVYSVTATGANGCFDVATVRVYKDLSTPTASLVASGTLSCNQPSVTLTAGGGTTYAFTGTGLVSQDVSGSAIVNAGGVYSVTATGANGCFDVATVRVYKDLSTPTASLVASGTLSCNQPSVTLTAGGGTTYAFTGTGLVSQDVSGSAIVNAGGVYSVTATGANGCFDVATVRVYKDLSTPTASLVASGTLSCNQPSVTLTAGGGTTYAFTGAGLVSQDVSGSAIVNAGGVYSVTATGANGCFDVATVRVYKDLSTPTASLVASGTLSCNQPSVTLTAGGGTTYAFTGAGLVSQDVSGSAIVNAGGVYSVTATGANGCFDVATVRVYKDLSTPTASLVASGTLSCNQPSVTLTAGGGTTYAFTGTGLVSQDVSGSAIVNAGGVYSVTATGANGCFDVATVRVYKDLSTPTASLVASGTLSCNQPSVTLTAGGGTTYAFTGAGLVSQDVSGSAIVNAGGVYSVTATGANGCFDVATVRVYKDLSTPTASLVASGTLSCNQPSVTLTAGGGTTYAFTGTGLVSQDVSGSAIVNAGGVYSVTATGANGCFDVATVRVYKDLSTPTASLVASGTLSCNQPSVTLTAGGGTTYAFTGTGLVSQDVSGSAIVNAGGVYSVTATGANGCFDVATVRVYKDLSTPTASLVASGTLSCNQPSVTLTAGGGTTYAFTGAGLVSQDVSGSAIVNAGGVYSVTATGANGCFDVATVRVYKDLSTPTASLVASGTLSCNQPSVTLTAGGGTTYAFTGTGLVSQDVSGSAIVNAGGVYSVTATGANGCFDVASVNVMAQPAPTLSSVSQVAAVCPGSPATINLTGLPENATLTVGYSINGINQPPVSVTTSNSSHGWTPADPIPFQTRLLTAADNGVALTITSIAFSGGCSQSFNMAVSLLVNPTPVATLSATGPLTCAQTSVTLTAGGGTTYAFSGPNFTQTGPANTAVVSQGGAYSVLVTGVGGCTDTQSTTVIASTTLATPDFATRGNPAVADGLTSLTVSQNSPAVAFGATTCQGTLNWSGNGQSGLTTLNAPTSATGVFVYQATCTVGTCVSSPTSVTLTVNPVPVVSTARLVVLQRDPDNGQLNTNTLKPYLVLDNQGTTPIPYGQLTLRYWLTLEDPAPLNFRVNAQLGAQQVHLTYVPVSPLRQGATGYVEVSFDATAGSLAAGTNSGEIQSFITKADYSYFNQGDDYSYMLNRDYAPNAHITAYLGGQLIYGTEPGAVVPVGVSALSLTASASPATLLTTASTVLTAQATGGTPGYSYSFSGPGTITPRGNTASVSGLPAGVQTFTVLVSDASQPSSQTLSTTVSVTVSAPANTPPTTTANTDQTAIVGVGFSYTANAFTDAETPNNLTYSASLNPANGLTVNPVTRVISGTPVSAGVVSVTITATDPGGLSASTVFTITVSASAVVSTARLVVLQRDPDNGQLNTNTLKPYLVLDNQGTTPIPYGQLTLRYWLTLEDPAPLNFRVNAQLGAQQVHLTYVPVSPLRQGATGYVEVSFDATAGSLAAGTNSGEIQSFITKADYSYFNQGDDYSYMLNRDYAPNAHITAYLSGQLIYGTEPGAAGVRQGVVEAEAPLRVKVLGNPVPGSELSVEIEGAAGQPLRLEVTDLTGHLVTERAVERAATIEQQRLPLSRQPAGLFFLRVSTPTQSQTVKVFKAD